MKLKTELEKAGETTTLFCQYRTPSSSLAPRDFKNNHPTVGKQGIRRGCFHRILRLEEVSGKEFRFVQLRNFWGVDTNWNSPFAPGSNEWEKFKDVKQALQLKTGEQIMYSALSLYVVEIKQSGFCIKRCGQRLWFWKC